MVPILIALIGMYGAVMWLCIVSFCLAAAYGDRILRDPGDGQP